MTIGHGAQFAALLQAVPGIAEHFPRDVIHYRLLLMKWLVTDDGLYAVGRLPRQVIVDLKPESG